MSDKEIHTPIDSRDQSYMDDRYTDGRLDHGAGARPVASDLDFINMSGLTKPLALHRESSNPNDSSGEDMRSDALVSFFEEGVEDVDHGGDPDLASFADDEILGESTSDVSSDAASFSAAVTGLDALIAEVGQPNEVVTESTSDRPIESEETAPDDNIESLMMSLESELESAAIPADPAPEEPVVAEDSRLPSESLQAKAAVAFEEAETLLHELDTQEREVPAPALESEPPSAPSPLPVETAPAIVLDDHGSEGDASVYTKPPLTSGTPRVQGRPRRATGARLAVFSMLFLATTGFALYVASRSLLEQTMSPADAYGKGVALMNDGHYAEAASHFDDVASRYASDPLSIEAEFMSAYALYQIAPDAQPESQDAYRLARQRMDRFVTSYPAHEKAPRGETLLAMLDYRLGNYESAIQVLSDPQRRLRDPDAYLPSLRTLARSHSKLGNLQMAESEFMHAAMLKENMSPELDYLELAGIYNDLGLGESHPGLAASYLKKAVEHWERAMQLPGTLRTTYRELEARCEYTRKRVRELESTRDEMDLP